MPKKNHPTVTLSIRIPIQVREWLDECGGGEFAKAIIISTWFECCRKGTFPPYPMPTKGSEDIDIFTD